MMLDRRTLGCTLSGLNGVGIMEVDKDMAETDTKMEKKLATASRAANRRKGALEKIHNGRPSVVSEKHLRKLVKQAQRRKNKFAKELERHAVKKPAVAEAPAEAAAETAAETAPETAPEA